MVLIFYIVFSQLAVGGLALLLLIPKDLVGRGFYRLMGLIYLLVMVFARCANLAINGNRCRIVTDNLCYLEAIKLGIHVKKQCKETEFSRKNSVSNTKLR